MVDPKPPINDICIKQTVLTLLCLCLLSISNSQVSPGKLWGSLRDSATGEPISNATISISRVGDTAEFKNLRSTNRVATSSDQGHFEILDLDSGVYQLTASCKGYATISRLFSLAHPSLVHNSGTLLMHKDFQMLAEVVIKDLTPIRVSGDTTSYNARAFKTNPNANVEELLKKLPGIQVDGQGNLTAQGEQVQRVYVDGKEFFNNDPKLATRNLTADMIDQVQVYNDLSDQAKFNGIDDGSRTRAINLKLKKEKKRGVLGRVYLGVGTNNRYIGGASVNYFKGASQLSVLAGTNNINNTGNPASNIANTGTGSGIGSGTVGTGQAGITYRSMFGVSYRDTWSENLDVSASYSLDHNKLTNVRESNKTTFFRDSTFLADQATTYNNTDKTHRFNVSANLIIDTFNSILFKSAFTTQLSTVAGNDSFINYTAVPGNIRKTMSNIVLRSNDGTTTNLVSSLLWRKAFSRRGRTFSVNLTTFMNRDQKDGYNTISSVYHNPDETVNSKNNSNLRNLTGNQTSNYAVNISYTEPIRSGKLLEFHYSHSRTESKTDRTTYNLDTLGGIQKGLVDSLSNHFQTTNSFNRYGLNFKGGDPKISYQFGVALQHTWQERNDSKIDHFATQRFLNVIPNLMIGLRLNRNNNFQFNYRASNNFPSVIQMQNVTDITRYPFVFKGNPELRPEFVNHLSASFHSTNPTNYHNLFANITFSKVNNKIANSIQSEGAVQTYVPINLNGVYYVGGSVNYGIPLRNMEAGNIDFTTHFDFNRNINVLNGVRNSVRNLSVGQDVQLSYNYNEHLDFELNTSISYNRLNSSVQIDQPTSFFIHDYTVAATYSPFDRTIIASQASYLFYTGNDEFDQRILLWNASLARQLFKNRRGELKLSIHDILNQNRSVSRNIMENFIEDVRNKALGRFFMVTFLYNFNKTGL
jgi:hypothetical protein